MKLDSEIHKRFNVFVSRSFVCLWYHLQQNQRLWYTKRPITSFLLQLLFYFQQVSTNTTDLSNFERKRATLSEKHPSLLNKSTHNGDLNQDGGVSATAKNRTLRSQYQEEDTSQGTNSFPEKDGEKQSCLPKMIQQSMDDTREDAKEGQNNHTLKFRFKPEDNTLDVEKECANKEENVYDDILNSPKFEIVNPESKDGANSVRSELSNESDTEKTLMTDIDTSEHSDAKQILSAMKYIEETETAWITRHLSFNNLSTWCFIHYKFCPCCL